MCRATVATPPPIPMTRTVSPGRMRARLTSARWAVSPASGRAADSSHDRRDGRGRTFAAGMRISSA